MQDAFWAAHESNRVLGRSNNTPEQLRQATIEHNKNINALVNATYRYNSGQMGQEFHPTSKHSYQHELHKIDTTVPFASAYAEHIEALPPGAVYASAYPPPPGTKVRTTIHGAKYWRPTKGADGQEKKEDTDGSNFIDPENSDLGYRPSTEGQAGKFPSDIDARRNRGIEEELAEQARLLIPKLDPREKNTIAFKESLEEAKNQMHSPLVVNKGKNTEFTYYGQSRLLPLQADIDAGKAPDEMTYIRTPHGRGVVKYRSGNIRGGSWSKGAFVAGHHINPSKPPGVLSTAENRVATNKDRISHMDANLSSPLVGIGNVGPDPLSERANEPEYNENIASNARTRRRV